MKWETTDKIIVHAKNTESGYFAGTEYSLPQSNEPPLKILDPGGRADEK